nr:MAG TPA: hypothetical protein [Caudoviricetes sp.]DAP82775.1 MAG TPA: hypothetical protein [Caudoviricetes sp.]
MPEKNNPPFCLQVADYSYICHRNGWKRPRRIVFRAVWGFLPFFIWRRGFSAGL